MDPTAKTEGQRLVIGEWSSTEFAIEVRMIRISRAGHGRSPIPGWICESGRSAGMPLVPWKPFSV